jgi:Ca2+/Na+ antiporter
MNFDEIKSKWDQENSKNIQVPESVSKLRKAQHPIDKLKRNMKFELITQIATLIILPFYFGNRFSGDIQDLLLGVYAVFVLICLYYLYNFYRFYKQSVAYSADSRESLNELYYSLRLNMERYKSLGFLILPFIMILLGLNSIESGENTSQGWPELLVNLKRFLISMVVVAGIYIGAVIVWVDILYGKYARQIKDALDELKEEDQA